MGNNQSSDAPGSTATASAPVRSHSRRQSEDARRSLSHANASQKRQAHGKTPPNPSAALGLGPGAASTSTSVTTAHATVSASPTHSRARSVTTTTPKLIPVDVSSSHKSDSAAMGNADSKPHQRPPSRSNTLPNNAAPPRKAAPTTQEHKATASPAPTPVNMPPSSKDGQEDDFIPGYSGSPYGLPPANYSRPPRMPLPIEEEVHTPGSPIITPQDVQGAVSQLDSAEIEGGDIPRKSSVLSSTTIDDDEIGDNEAFAAESSQWGEVRVPTKLEWTGHGDKVFVTGTFCNWEKKMKLHKNKDGPGFSAVVQLPPGTHHAMFLVDGQFLTSHQLPTTVDWTNTLVNYIEIVAPLPTDKSNEKQTPAPAAPMPIPGAAMTAGQAIGTAEPASRPNAHLPETEKDISTDDTVGPKGEKAGSAPKDTPVPAATPVPTKPSQSPQTKPKPASTKQKLPRPKYTNHVPDFLTDLDTYNTDEDRSQRAQRAVGILPQPPSLPMFLSKSILNGATPHKDDASVLVLPNHTVLNHLATSSIKNGVLATSGTTRYKRKFLTTIMYKPTSDDG